jgi:sortase A
VAKKQPAGKLSVEELRHLLVEKRRSERQARLDQFRKTGRVIIVSPEPTSPTIDAMRTDVTSDEASHLGDSETKRRHKPFFDRLLLMVEILAVGGLLLILVTGLNVLTNLNKEVASALVLPTLTPTPLISAVVLPSGHTPPGEGLEVLPNDAEIPANLRPLVQAMASMPIPTPGPEQAQRIQIPAINIDAPVVQGDGWEQLKKGVAQHIGTPNPGQKGNLVLSAHNDVFGEIFKNLDKLKTGDQIIVFTNQNQYTYVVVNSQVVLPTQVEVMGPTPKATVTLISCYPYRVDNRRIVITAELIGNN